MIRTAYLLSCLAILGGAACLATVTGCGGAATASAPTGITPEKFADGVHAVMMADRTVYARDVVTRLKKQSAPVKPDEYWDEWTDDSGDPHMMPLPAQMFRMGASIVNANAEESGFTYSLKSLWPLNPNHKPANDEEIEALKYLSDHPGETFSKTVTIDGKKYFTKYYPDRAVAEACWTCHNEHERREDDYPEFGKDDVMGAVYVEVPLD